MNQPTRLLQIVPATPPSAEGVSATAEAIANGLASEYGVVCSFAVPNRDGLSSGSIDAQRPDVVLTHYVNYAYEAHGRPRNLVRDLEQWSHAHPGRLWTYFHEIYASGRPWQRTFFTARTQRTLAARLAEASAYCLSSLPEYGEQLRAIGYRGDLTIRPIVSTVGEPHHSGDLGNRGSDLIIFGSPGRRRLAYESRELVSALAALDIERIVDIGGGAVAPLRVGNIAVTALGTQPSDRVSAALLRARAGFLVYPLDFLGKSSVFAAYAAHGVLPICTGRCRARNEAPRAREHFWDIAADPRLPPDAEQHIANRARVWYSEHRLEQLVADLAARIGER